MDTVEAFEKEIAMQLDFVRQFVPQRKLSIKRQKNSVFCGTGDSFASAQLAEVFSNFKVRVYDPLDLIKNKKLVAGRDLYLVSISGNTVSNVKLAKMHKKTVAITANPDSRLAKACKNLVLLKFDSTGIQTSGSISFLASALGCISLVSKYQIRNVSKIYQSAIKAAKTVSLGKKVYVLGNLYTMPIAVFCAAKLHEVLGANAYYERIEQFSHASLFSARRGDTVLLFEPKNPHNDNLLKSLKGYGLDARRMEPPTKNLQDQILFFIFVSELIALYAAKKKRKKNCFFIEEKRLRHASSSMIY
ncbi:MAG: sugar isomerase [Thaumarchaeota archaeon]|nr:sugar isomerase [Nitrososphaerota archaeon]